MSPKLGKMLPPASFGVRTVCDRWLAMEESQVSGTKALSKVKSSLIVTPGVVLDWQMGGVSQSTVPEEADGTWSPSLHYQTNKPQAVDPLVGRQQGSYGPFFTSEKMQEARDPGVCIPEGHPWPGKAARL